MKAVSFLHCQINSSLDHLLRLAAIGLQASLVITCDRRDSALPE